MTPLRHPRSTFASLVALSLSACAPAPASSPPSPDLGRAAPATATPALFLPGLVSTADDDDHVTLDPDGRTLYFVRGSPHLDHYTLLELHRDGDRWGRPEVAPFSGRYTDADLFITADGAAAYFVSTRPVDGAPKDDTDIFEMRRTSSGAWGEPRPITALNSTGNEWFPTVTDDGTIYFGSERRPGNLGPEGTSDLWRARRAGDGYGPPENLGPMINTAKQDIEAFVARDESYVLFSTDGRPDTLGAYDLYVSYRRGAEWTTPIHLEAPINSRGWEFGAKPSPDGSTLYFTSSRGFTDAPLDRRLDFAELESRLHAPGNGLRDVYCVDLRARPLPKAP